MPKGNGASALPGHDVLRSFLESDSTPLGPTDILRALGLPPHLKAALRTTLHDMALAGDLARLPAGRLKAISGLPETAYAKVTRLRSDGHAYAQLVEDPNVSLLLVATLPDGSLLLPDDVVVARLRPRTSLRARREARPLRLVSAAPRRIPASIAPSEPPSGFPPTLSLIPCDRRLDLTLTAPASSDATLETGTVVLAEVQPSSPGTALQAHICGHLGAADAPGMAAQLSILTHPMPTAFSVAAEEQARVASAEPVVLINARHPDRTNTPPRKDLRHLPLITIDDVTAQDFDDAIWAERTQDGFHLVIAIADVAHYVPEGSPLDLEARERGNSVYLPGHTLPMLPLSLSAGACSLKPNEDRFCVFVDLTLSSDGRILSGTLGRGILRSAARLTYQTVQTALDTSLPLNKSDLASLPADQADALKALPADLLPTLQAAAIALQTSATTREGDTGTETEPVVTFDDAGNPTAFTPRQRLPAHDLVASFMIAANRFAAEELHRRRAPGLYRTHPAPTNTEPSGRLMARYSASPGQHYGLGLDYYTHFTSPIRRYADLVTHRALLATGVPAIGSPPPQPESEHASRPALHALAEHLHFTERRAASATQACLNRLAAVFLRSFTGQTLQATVTGTTRSGIALTLTKTGTPSFLFRSALPDDSGMYDDSHHARTRMPSEAMLRAGTVLSVVLTTTNPAQGTLGLAIAPNAR
ncbi:ribonuclease R family protein [Acetobacter indonesiensis]|uniref:ribonuclease R family protein n=1 Tax=Acetobacter indonesiensis TaxID=104101 RepID=UPI0020A2DE07|nr:ribonuclease R family protein [Acetobacter indonesiensis]MCP1231584.1 ribonuclease R [Acetobacter indonesiensis]